MNTEPSQKTTESPDRTTHHPTFDVWWHNAGSGMPPLPGETAEEHVRRISAIAWRNGEYKCSAWRDPDNDPPTKTGKILVWIEGLGPSIVNVEERWMSYWNCGNETEPAAPYEWDRWMEIPPPNDKLTDSRRP